ncbi:MAG: hypothetical protein ACRBDI_05205 [Alphaproteobacteria bacterium]
MARLLRAGHGKPPRGGDIKNLTKHEALQLAKARLESHENKDGIATLEFRGETRYVLHSESNPEKADHKTEINSEHPEP